LFGMTLALVVRDPAFRREAMRGPPFFWSMVAIVALAWEWHVAAGTPLLAQILTDIERLIAFVVDNSLQWAIASALIGLVAGTMSDIASYRKRGDYFVWVASTSIGFRLVIYIFLFAIFWIFFVDSSRRSAAQGLLLLMLATDILLLTAAVIGARKAAAAATAQSLPHPTKTHASPRRRK